jgi:plastocyanin domain-containing protein
MPKLTTLLLLTVLACSKKPEGGKASGSATELRVTVDAVGYHPEEAHAPAGKPVRLIFTRTTDEGCGQELVFPSLKLKRDLPLNQPVSVDVTMPASGKLAFTCGMDMMKGAIVAD